jgi:hypothetical protein
VENNGDTKFSRRRRGHSRPKMGGHHLYQVPPKPQQLLMSSPLQNQMYILAAIVKGILSQEDPSLSLVKMHNTLVKFIIQLNKFTYYSHFDRSKQSIWLRKPRNKISQYIFPGYFSARGRPSTKRPRRNRRLTGPPSAARTIGSSITAGTLNRTVLPRNQVSYIVIQP